MFDPGTEVPQLWSQFLRRHSPTERTVRPFRAAADAVSAHLERVRGDVPDDLRGTELLKYLRETGLDPERLAWGPRRTRRFEVFEEANSSSRGPAEDHYRIPAGASHPVQRRMVALAAEWRFVPYAEGLSQAIELTPREEREAWVDVRSVVQLIWYWADDEEPLLGRALAATLDLDEAEPHPYGPFVRLFAAVLEPHVEEADRRVEIARRFAQQAAAGLQYVQGGDVFSSDAALMRPALELARAERLVKDRRSPEQERAELLRAYARYSTSVALGYVPPKDLADVVSRLSQLQALLEEDERHRH